MCSINPSNAELNPMCSLLALLGAHHFLHVSRIRVKSLTLRLLMSYIYIYDISSLRVKYLTTIFLTRKTGGPVWHWPLRSMINMQMLKETRQRLVINGYYYTQSFNKIKNIISNVMGTYFGQHTWKTFHSFCKEHLQKYTFEPHHISVYL